MNELKIMQGYADRVTAALSPMPEEDLPYAVACLRALAQGLENEDISAEVKRPADLPSKVIVCAREVTE